MRRLLVGVVVAALVFAPAAAGAQAVDGFAVTAVDTSAHPQVSVRVSAPRGPAGTPLPGEAFALQEEGQARSVQVEQVRGRDLEVVLALDTSGSMGEEAMAAAKAAAAGVLDQLPPGTAVAVVGFATQATVVSALSADAEAHRAAISALTAGGHTALYDAVALSLAQFADPGAQRAVVVLSDGGDTTSATPLTEVSAGLARSGATLHAVELTTGDTQPAVLGALAAAGNGRHSAVSDPGGLAAVYAALAAELRDSYVLTYTSEATGRVDLHVSVSHPAGRAEVAHRVSLPSPPLVAFAPGVLASPWTLAAGAGLVFAALFVLLVTALLPGQARSLLSRRSATAPRSLPGMTTLASRATLVVEHTLHGRGWTPSLNGALERAGVGLRPGEFVILALCAALVGFAGGLLLSGLLAAVLVSAVVAASAVLGLHFLGQRRKARFTDQLSETLQLMAGTLRAGYGLLQAVDAVSREADSPTAEEFRRIVVETRLGRDLEQSLQAMQRRVGSEELAWVVQAIAIHQDVGGDLAEVLDTVAGTIRERNQIRRQVQALSAEGKLSALILYALPFLVGGFIALTNPDYLSELFTDPIGWAMLSFTAVLLAIGGVWLRKVIRLVF